MSDENQNVPYKKLHIIFLSSGFVNIKNIWLSRTMPFLFNKVRNVLKFAVSCQDCKLHLSAAFWFSGSSAEQRCFTSLWWAFSLIKLILYLLQCFIFHIQNVRCCVRIQKRSKIAPSKTGSTMACVFDGTQWEHFLFQPKTTGQDNGVYYKRSTSQKIWKGKTQSVRGGKHCTLIGLCSDETQTQIGQRDLTLEETSLKKWSVATDGLYYLIFNQRCTQNEKVQSWIKGSCSAITCAYANMVYWKCLSNCSCEAMCEKLLKTFTNCQSIRIEWHKLKRKKVYMENA